MIIQNTYQSVNQHIFLLGSFKPPEIIYATWQPNHQVKFSRRAERERRGRRLEEEIGSMGKKGVMGCYVALVEAFPCLIYHAYGCGGYPWGVCIHTMLSNSSHGQIPTNRLYLPMQTYQHP